jgi:hypothetical protein
MNSKTVLQKIMTLLSKEEVKFTYARLKDGTIVESPTFDVNEPLEVVSEDGTKIPAPDGEHELELKDSEGNETYIKVFTEGGIIKERENVELEDVKVEDTPQAGNADKENVMPEVPGQIASGTIKAAEVDEVSDDMPETDGKPLAEVEEETELGSKIEKMAYRIAEMEKKIMKMEEAMTPPVDEEVVEEEMIEEELPKLDGAPTESVKMAAIQTNNKNFGKKVVNSQSNFLSKLYK